MTPRFVVGEELKTGRIVAVLERFRAPGRSLHALLPAGKFVAPKTRAFVEFFARRFRSAPPWAGGGGQRA